MSADCGICPFTAGQFYSLGWKHCFLVSDRLQGWSANVMEILSAPGFRTEGEEEVHQRKEMAVRLVWDHCYATAACASSQYALLIYYRRRFCALRSTN